MASYSKSNKNEIETDIRNWLSNPKKVVIAGVGNPLRKDDFVGGEIVRNLQNRVSQSVYLIECETVPEDFLKTITEFKPTHILVIDAAMLNLEPGSPKLIEPDQIMKRPPTSTHALSIRVFCEYLARTTSAKIALLAIQPYDTSFGEGLTSSLRETAKNLTDLLSNILP